MKKNREKSWSWLFVVTAILATACASTRTVRIESTPPARVINDQAGCLICDQTPCNFTFSRQTCTGLFDSSSGYLIIRAVLDAERSVVIAYRTCEIERDEVLRFDFATATTTPPPQHHLGDLRRCQDNP